MSDQNRKRLPIGYWLKRADEVLTKRIDAAQRSNGLRRLEWQALNVIHERRKATRNEIVDTLRPFADAGAMDDMLGGLVHRELVSGAAENEFELTQAGVELYDRAHALQQAIRQQAVAGISETEYAMALSVLQRLVENLEHDGAA
jgi:DNA-binding MarR family transcriptional regulator